MVDKEKGPNASFVYNNGRKKNKWREQDLSFLIGMEMDKTC